MKPVLSSLNIDKTCFSQLEVQQIENLLAESTPRVLNPKDQKVVGFLFETILSLVDSKFFNAPQEQETIDWARDHMYIALRLFDKFFVPNQYSEDLCHRQLSNYISFKTYRADEIHTFMIDFAIKWIRDFKKYSELMYHFGLINLEEECYELYVDPNGRVESLAVYTITSAIRSSDFNEKNYQRFRPAVENVLKRGVQSAGFEYLKDWMLTDGFQKKQEPACLIPINFSNN